MNQETINQAKLRLGIVGSAPALIKAVDRALRVAPIDLSVLITGESGSGKEFFPQLIHAYSPRKHSRYIAVNCGAIPEGTIDSELFGHEKGSFTGAVAARKGYFEEADGGTIFLDEVAELPLTTQARLLRVLESGEFLKVGSSVVQKTNIRVVAATNVDMPRAVAEGRFRQDLFYRLSTVQISVPPLRERPDDIPLLARKFAADFAERYRTPEVSFSEEARMALVHYRWPGNVRQLKNVVEQMGVFEAGTDISADTLKGYLPEVDQDYTPALRTSALPAAPHSYEKEREMLFNLIFRLQREIEGLRKQLSPKPSETAPDSGSDYVPPVTDLINVGRALRTPLRGEFVEATEVEARKPQPQPQPQPNATIPVATASPAPVPVVEVTNLVEAEKEAIRQALQRHCGSRKEAAAQLGISERTIYRKIKEFGLE